MASRLFLARTEEQNKFRQVLQSFQTSWVTQNLPTLTKPFTQGKSEIKSPHIFLLHGEGGMGKSSLSERLKDITEKEFKQDVKYLWLDWETEQPNYPTKLQVGKTNIQPESILEILHERLGEVVGQCQQYLETKDKLAKIEEQIDRELRTQEKTEEYRVLIGGGLTVALNALRLNPNINAIITAADALGATQFLTQSGAIALTKLIHQKLSLADRQLYLNPTMQLAKALGTGLGHLAKRKPIVIFMDTYEIVDRPECDYGLRQVIKSAGKNVVWVIAGRADLTKSRRLADRQFRGYEQDFNENLYSYSLAEFDGELVQKYFEGLEITRPLPEDGAERIAAFSLGIPFVVSQIADIWETAPEIGLNEILARSNHDSLGESGYDKVIRQTSERFLKHCFAEKAPEDLKMICAISLLRQPNIELLRVMLQRDDLEVTLNRLQQQHSFILLDGKIRLHNKIEDFLKEALRSESILFNLQIQPTMLAELNELAVMFLQDELKKRTENLALENWYQDERITNGLLDLVHHLFWLDEDRGWAEAVPRFVEAWGYDYRWAESLLEVIAAFSSRLCSLGQRRLDIFQADFVAGSSEKETQMLLNELEKIAQQTTWLKAEFQAERDIVLLLRTGWVRYTQKAYPEALRICLEIEKQLPENVKSLKESLGTAFGNIGDQFRWQDQPDYESAIIAYEHSVKWQEKNESSWFGKGCALAELGSNEEAIASYDKALEIKPDDHDAWNGRGVALRRLGRNEEAIASFDKALEIKPDYHEAWNNRGVALWSLGRNEEAITYFDKALAIKLDYHEAWDNRGVILGKLGRNEEAIASFDKALEIKPDDANTYYNKACLFSLQTKIETALELLTKAIDLDPICQEKAKTDSDFDAIRDDPRFQALIQGHN